VTRLTKEEAEAEQEKNMTPEARGLTVLLAATSTGFAVRAPDDQRMMEEG
jgi:hypothetical protein